MAIEYQIDDRDLRNLMRHMFLIGWNCGATRRAAELGDFQEDEREQAITELIDDYKKEYHCGYGEFPCSCEKSHK